MIHIICTHFYRIRQEWNTYHRPHYRPPLLPPSPPLIAHDVIRIWDEYGPGIRWIAWPTSRLLPQNGCGASSYKLMQEIASSVALISVPPRLWRSSMSVWVLVRRSSTLVMLIWRHWRCYRHRVVGWLSKRKWPSSSGLWLFFSYSITDSDVLATLRTR